MRNALIHIAVIISAVLISGCALSTWTAQPGPGTLIEKPDQSRAVKPAEKSGDKNGDEDLAENIGKSDKLSQENEIAVLKGSSHYYNFIAAQLQVKSGNLDRAIVHMQQSVEDNSDSSYLQRELAVLFLHQKNTQRALDVINQRLKGVPDDLDALILYGRIKQNLKHYDDARTAYEKVISRDPKRENVYLHLGSLYMARKDNVNASRVYSMFVEHFPSSYIGHFYLGKIKAEEGDLKEAEREFQKTVELEPDLEEPRFELLNIYKKKGKDAKAILMYQEIIKRNPGNLRAAMGLGYYYHQKGELQAAEELFTGLRERSTSDQAVVRKVVQLYLDTKQFDAAIVILKGMLKGMPDSSDLNYVIGIAYDGLKNKNMTIRHLEKVKPDSKFYQKAVFYVSVLYRELGKAEKAIDFLRTAINSAPRKPVLMLYLGDAYEEAGDYEEAVKVFKQGLDIDPENIRLRFRLGTVYDQRGMKEASIEEMKTVIRLDPENANALNYLGYTYADLGRNLEEAERLIKEALKYKPDDGYITDSLGWVYYKKGLYNKALKLLEKAVELEPDDPIILEHVGDTYIQMDNRSKALEFYDRSLKKKKKDKSELEEKIRKLTEKGL